MKTRKIVLNTLGSLGELHPYVAFALELRERGHRPIIAANNSHRSVAEAEGIEFHAVRPDVGDFGNESELMKKVMDLKSGPAKSVSKCYSIPALWSRREMARQQKKEWL